jgi:hypothetical protein
MISWKPFEYGGLVYDLSHLHPHLEIYKQAAKPDRLEREYEVQVFYSLHCFSKRLMPNGDVDSALLYSDSRETRVFDRQRYELSKRLPQIVRSLPKASCYHTGHGNFFTLDLLDQETGLSQTYEVYFRASRSGKRAGCVNLFVESAYLRDQFHSTVPKRKKIGFFVILHNTRVGKLIKPAPP